MKPREGLSIVMSILIGALIWLWIAVAAFGHSFYSAGCCSGHDCAPIPFEAVVRGEDGWVVLLEPGQHPMAPMGGRWVMPYGAPGEQMSQDGYFHACILPMTQRLQCLYLAMSG